MQITDHVHSLKIPFQITSPDGQKIERFVYAYLIYGDEVCLIDSGVAHCQDLIIDYLNKTGRSAKEISRLILTHAHPDHIGSAAAIHSMTGCTVYAHEFERSWIEDINLQARERPVPGFFSLAGGSVSINKTLQDGDILDLGGDLRLEVIHTPGHSPGSISLLFANDGALFAADAVPICNSMPIYEDIFESIKSVERLASLPGIEVLLSAWDEPRREAEAQRTFSDGKEYLEHIHETVLRISREMMLNRTGLELKGIDPTELCKNVLAELGLPAFMANSLVAASFLSSMRVSTSAKNLERSISSG
jgi:glyoxylase-like metal-dependent hydrolase (beta-lactamase superfamily II)